MKIAIVIPAHNEEALIRLTLNSLIKQTLLPSKIIVVNDNSTDNTAEIVTKLGAEHSFITLINNNSNTDHLPGSKVINAFYKGYDTLNSDFDIICKFDADLIFPDNYLERIVYHFNKNKNIGMAGGFCYINKNEDWVLENLTNKDHIRGALKAYRKECFSAIGGLKKAMGWDTVDELLAKYHNWEIITDESLHVKHLKPTGNTYNKKAKYKQGEAFYKMRYGFVITFIAAVKLAYKKRKPNFIIDYLSGYLKAKREKQAFLVSKKEGGFIRSLRWNGIKEKLF